MSDRDPYLGPRQEGEAADQDFLSDSFRTVIKTVDSMSQRGFRKVRPRVLRRSRQLLAEWRRFGLERRPIGRNSARKPAVRGGELDLCLSRFARASLS